MLNSSAAPCPYATTRFQFFLSKAYSTIFLCFCCSIRLCSLARRNCYEKRTIESATIDKHACCFASCYCCRVAFFAWPLIIARSTYCYSLREKLRPFNGQGWISVGRRWPHVQLALFQGFDGSDEKAVHSGQRVRNGHDRKISQRQELFLQGVSPVQVSGECRCRKRDTVFCFCLVVRGVVVL